MVYHFISLLFLTTIYAKHFITMSICVILYYLWTLNTKEKEQTKQTGFNRIYEQNGKDHQIRKADNYCESLEQRVYCLLSSSGWGIFFKSTLVLECINIYTHQGGGGGGGERKDKLAIYPHMCCLGCVIFIVCIPYSLVVVYCFLRQSFYGTISRSLFCLDICSYW